MVFVILFFLGKILEFIIVNNSENFILFIFSVPKSSIINKSEFKILLYKSALPEGFP